MIGVFVRNDDRVEIFGFLANGREAAREIPDAQTRIDQNPGFRRREERRVSPAAAR